MFTFLVYGLSLQFLRQTNSEILYTFLVTLIYVFWWVILFAPSKTFADQIRYKLHVFRRYGPNHRTFVLGGDPGCCYLLLVRR